MNIRHFLNHRIHTAMIAVGAPADCSPLIAPSKNVSFGDYQANGAMAAGKKMGLNPRELAQRVVEKLDLDEVAKKIEVAGPGFINIHLKEAWLGKQLADALNDGHLGVERAQPPQTVVIDYSSPNLAKEMHVGHLRSTIIGDTLARLLEFLGHKVIRQNHVGDWGTQFGMLIAELESHLLQGEQADLALQDLETFYQQAKKHFDADESFAERARNYVVKLQGGDEKVLALWRQFRAVSLHHSEEIYEKLGVSLTAADVRGESAYNDDLAVVVKALKDQGLAQEDQGAQVVFLPELADKDGNPSPVIIQKKDGGYLYSTSDLASIRYRANTLLADRVMYFIDARQSLHMQQVFTVAKKAGFAPEKVSLEHHAFGTMMGEDGTPFKTRDGGTVKLASLLDEAVERAEAVVMEKDPALEADERKVVARKVGVGAVKYADLSKTRTHDYIFSWDAMLSFEGNTSPYLQYAYTRIRSIQRKAAEAGTIAGMVGNTIKIMIQAEQERSLALKCLQFEESLQQVAQDAYPHVLCTYLYDLSALFMAFYESCPILKAEVEVDVRNSRLNLCELVAQTLACGLNLLGIEVMERM